MACETRISTFELMNVCGNKGKFYGIDISRNVLEAAKNIASGSKLSSFAIFE
jgi:ubiquinone/menaquinone biosynthesis C-methylase UbiE